MVKKCYPSNMERKTAPPPAQKREKTWMSMSISNDVFDRLDIVRERTEKEVGMRLSWTKFFAWILRDLETPKKLSGNGK